MQKAIIVVCFFCLAFAGFPALAQRSNALVITKSKLLFEKRNFAEAKKLLLAVSTKSDYPEAQYYLGRIAVEEKQYDESIQRFENATAAKPDAAEYHNWLGVMYGVVAMSANKLKQAYLAPKIKNEFEKAAAIEPLNLPTQWGLINYYAKAPGFLGGSWDKAFACAKVIASQNKAQGLRALGFIHSAQNKTGEAEKEYLQAIEVDPANPENGYALAEFYDEHKKFDRAIEVCDGLLKKDPRNMVAAFHYGHTSAQGGQQLDKGIVYLNQYLIYTPKPNEPSLSNANLDLGMIYEKKGDHQKAKNYYLASLKLEPGMREAKDGLERVD